MKILIILASLFCYSMGGLSSKVFAADNLVGIDDKIDAPLKAVDDGKNNDTAWKQYQLANNEKLLRETPLGNSDTSVWKYFVYVTYLRYLFPLYPALIWYVPSAYMGAIAAGAYLQSLMSSHSKMIGLRNFFMTPFVRPGSAYLTYDSRNPLYFYRSSYCLTYEYMKILNDKYRAEQTFYDMMAGASAVAAVEGVLSCLALIPAPCVFLFALVTDNKVTPPSKNQKNYYWVNNKLETLKNLVTDPQNIFLSFFQKSLQFISFAGTDPFKSSDFTRNPSKQMQNYMNSLIEIPIPDAEAATMSKCDDESKMQDPGDDLSNIGTPYRQQWCGNLTYTETSATVVPSPTSPPPTAPPFALRGTPVPTPPSFSDDSRPDWTVMYNPYRQDVFNMCSQIDGEANCVSINSKNKNNDNSYIWHPVPAGTDAYTKPRLMERLGNPLLASFGLSGQEDWENSYKDHVIVCSTILCRMMTIFAMERVIPFAMTAEMVKFLKPKTKSALKKLNCRLQNYQDLITSWSPYEDKDHHGGPESNELSDMMNISGGDPSKLDLVDVGKGFDQKAICGPRGCSLVSNRTNKENKFNLKGFPGKLIGTISDFARFGDAWEGENNEAYRFYAARFNQNAAMHAGILNENLDLLKDKVSKDPRTGETHSLATGWENYAKAAKMMTTDLTKSFDGTGSGIGQIGNFQLQNNGEDSAGQNGQNAPDLAGMGFGLQGLNTNPFDAAGGAGGDSGFKVDGSTGSSDGQGTAAEDPNAGDIGANLAKYDVKGNDITTNSGESIFKLISTRYIRSFYTYLAKVGKEKKTGTK